MKISEYVIRKVRNLNYSLQMILNYKFYQDKTGTTYIRKLKQYDSEINKTSGFNTGMHDNMIILSCL
jgi:hypothetical protein